MKLATTLSLLLLAGAVQAQSASETVDNPQAGVVVPASQGPIWEPRGTPPLFSNGTFVTAATGGGPAGTSPVSALTAPDTTFGAACAGATFRLADDFTVPAGQNWNVTGVTVFGYLTQAAPGGSTVSPMTGSTLRIWNGPPNVGTSTVVFGDTTTNRMTTTSFAGAWRVTSTTLTNLQRPISAAVMGNLNVNLGPGTYWIDYGVAGGTFCPPNTTVSAANNALQFTVSAATWAPVTDTGGARPLDFPFVIDGTNAGPNITPAVAAGAVNLGSTLAPNAAISSVFGFTNSAMATGPGTVSCALTGAPAGFAVAPAGAQSIAVGGTQNFTVTGNAPAAAGAFSGGTLTCTVQGLGAPVVYTLSGTVVAAPSITPSIAAGNVSLGNTTPGGTLLRAFGFSNSAMATGSGTVSCALTGAPPSFAVAPAGAQTAAPGSTVTFTVSGSAPSAPGTFSAGTLTCTVEGLGAPVVYVLTGTASAPLTIPTLSQLGLLMTILTLLVGGMLMARRYS